MVEQREDLGFAGEAGDAVRVGGEGVGKNFDGDVTIELGVGRTPDFAHAALAEFGRDAVMGDALLRAHRAQLQASYHFSPYAGRRGTLFGSNPAGMPLSGR